MEMTLENVSALFCAGFVLGVLISTGFFKALRGTPRNRYTRGHSFGTEEIVLTRGFVESIANRVR
jgi:hypothetical protein